MGCLRVLRVRLAQPKNAWFHAHQSHAHLTTTASEHPAQPHQSLTDSRLSWRCATQETPISRPVFVSCSTVKRLLKERPQSFKVRPRTEIERKPSLARPLSHTLSEASQTDRDCCLQRHRRASTLGGRGERAVGMLSWSQQRTAMGVELLAASRSHRSRLEACGSAVRQGCLQMAFRSPRRSSHLLWLVVCSVGMLWQATKALAACGKTLWDVRDVYEHVYFTWV